MVENLVHPLSRTGASQYYHAYGNTPARDFLQNYAGEKEPKVLVIECGDIRSCFYTIWKNFDPDIPVRFDGVHFVVNDASAAVLARNILFLYLCLRMPKEDSELKKWLSGMWAIWYCHELYPDHDKLLHDSLDILCKYSEDWSSSDNPLHSMVKFTSPATLREVSTKWKMWLERDVALVSVQEVRASRSAIEIKISEDYSSLDSFMSAILTSSAEIPFEKGKNPKWLAAQRSEILAYVKTGNAYVENVLGLDPPSPAVQTSINVTFCEKEDGTSSLHCSSIPFCCYYQTVHFSSEQLHDVSSTPLMVADKYFQFLPLLANSFQQFYLWLQCSHKVLTSDKYPHFSFTFDCSHGLTFCYELEKTNDVFNVIDSSNLMVGIPNLVLSCIPLLKGNGLLYTTIRYNVVSFATAEKYLTCTFGFACKLFPVLLGVCCINHEGEGYSSPVIVQPCKVTSSQSDHPFREKHLLWNKVDPATVPQIFPSDMPLSDTVKNALLKSFEISIAALLNHPSGIGMTEYLSIETTMKLIQVFMSNTNADFDPLFWEPLAELLKKRAKPYLNGIQIHLFLHGVHMHLIVTEEDCPMCLKSPLSNTTGLFSGNLALLDTTASSSEFKLVTFVHKEECDDAEHLCDIARKDGNVHIFECALPTFAEKIHFYFYAPLELAQQQFKITIISVTLDSHNTMTTLQTQLLSNSRTSFASFKFFQAFLPHKRSYLESFGEVALHVSDGDSSDTVIKTFISASDKAGKKLVPQQLSSNAIQLSYGNHACKLVYPFPIAYDRIVIKVKESISISCPRAFQDFDIEKPLYIVSPDKELAFFTLTLSKDAMSSFSIAYQFTSTDIFQSVNFKGQGVSQMSPFLRLKHVLSYFFTSQGQCYSFVNPNSDKLTGLLLVNNRLLDYESNAPVLDVAYCLVGNDVDVLLPICLSISHQLRGTIESLPVDDVEYDILKKALSYFAKRTNGTCDTISTAYSRLNILREQQIQQHFTRAVVSLLPHDPDHNYCLNTSSPLDINEVHVPSQKCDHCCELVKIAEICTNCKKARYCSEECRKIHETSCMKDMASNVSQFPLCRYWYSGGFRFYYAFGNTAAEDLLQHTTCVKTPAVLLLGCGDIRSCFYTLWRHFDSSISKASWQFDGACFVLNDWSSAVLARNILFLHMCLQLPKGKQEKKKWLSAMWAIWYCHELYPDHQKALDDSLTFLLEKSGSLDQWANSDNNPLHHLIQFTNSSTLNKISEVWNMWLMKRVAVNSVEHMHFLRLSELQKHHNRNNSKADLIAFSFSHSATFINGDTTNGKKTWERVPEVLAYLKTGNCYAENVLDLKLRNLSTTVNLTLFERPNGVYSLHYGSMPYSGYYHTVDFSPTALASSQIAGELCNSLLVQNKVFKSLPLLANSVQQFTVWVQSASEILKEGSTSFSFMFNDQHAESFCHVLAHDGSSMGHNQFDLIHTSNLIDHLGPTNVILSTLPLLKQEGLLFTTTLLYKNFTDSVEKFLSVCFGFDCLLFPVILGIRCINHEGARYSSPVMIMPTPVDHGDMLATNLQHNRLLLWKKVLAHPLIFPQLPAIESGSITDALLDSIQVSAYALLAKSAGGRDILNKSCIETAILLLLTFRSYVNSDSDYKFWEPLSQALTASMKPFLCGFQTQALLHNLHIHLTVNESNCPICKGSPIQETIGLFCAEVPLPITFTPHFMIVVHQYQSSDAQYLCSEANKGKDVHIFDCIDAVVAAETLKLIFFAPLRFIEQNYRATLARTFLSDKANLIESLSTTSMRDMKIKFIQYHFAHTDPCQFEPESNAFGKVTLHIYDGEKGQLELSLNDSTVEALASHKLSTSKLSSSNKLELSCGRLRCSFKLKYPIDRVSIKISKVQRSIKVFFSRHSYEFDKENPVFIASPDHQLSLPPKHVSEEIMICHSGIQLSDEERQIANSRVPSMSPIAPLVKVKKALMLLFQYHENFFFFVSPINDLSGVVIVNKRLLDYQHKAPAIDLAFCFLDISNATVVERAWNAITKAQGRSSRGMTVDDSHNILLKRVLVYFSKRTNSSLQPENELNSRFQILHRYKINQHFTRAVVYLLYRDPDCRGREMAAAFSNTIFTKQETPKAGNPAIDEKCEYCKKYHPDAKKCSRCKKVSYCDKTCQAKHWPMHKLECKKLPAPTGTILNITNFKL